MNLDDVLLGFQVALGLENLLYVFIGVLIGMIVGILPGLGPAPTIALMLPLTYVIPAESAIVMSAGIYYGASTAAPSPPCCCDSPAKRQAW